MDQQPQAAPVAPPQPPAQIVQPVVKRTHTVIVPLIISLLIGGGLVGIFYVFTVNAQNSLNEQFNALSVRVRESEIAVDRFRSEIENAQGQEALQEVQVELLRVEKNFTCTLSGGIINDNECVCPLGSNLVNMQCVGDDGGQPVGIYQSNIIGFEAAQEVTEIPDTQSTTTTEQGVETNTSTVQ